MNKKIIHLSDFEISPYEVIYQKMQAHIHEREEGASDQLWLGEHLPCYTMGIRSHHQYQNETSAIPFIKSNRGGLTTYHGPGQLILYPLLDLKRLGLNHQDYVHELESLTLALLESHDISCQRRPDAPGIYTAKGEKIASLGLRIKKNISYHGLALNVAMDLKPFHAITPCGLSQIKMIDMHHYQKAITLNQIKHEIISQFCQHFGYTNIIHKEFFDYV